MDITIQTPATEDEWNQYYDLRWRLLRQPWQQPKGSEKDQLEDNSIHKAAILNNQVIAVGRIHFTDRNEAQIRYMAVDDTFQSKGVGRLILKSLESAAHAQNIHHIFLHARENAVDFYKKNQYQPIKSTHVLYGKIQHVLMKKSTTL